MFKVISAQLFFYTAYSSDLVLVLGCAQTPSTLRIEAWDISLEIALTQATREKGLSGRRRLSRRLLLAMPDEGAESALDAEHVYPPHGHCFG